MQEHTCAVSLSRMGSSSVAMMRMPYWLGLRVSCVSRDGTISWCPCPSSCVPCPSELLHLKPQYNDF